MLLKPVALILVFAVVGHLALPAPEKSSYVSASGYGPGGYKYASDPHSVYVSGPGYYAGASATTNGARASIPNFPYFQPFQPFAPFPAFTPYNFQYPFNSMQNYFNNLQQSILAAAKPVKYTAHKNVAYPYNSNSFAFPNFPPFPSGSGSSSSASSSAGSFGFPLGNRFGEEQTGGSGGSVSSSAGVQGSKPGFVGVFSSSSHGTSNVNGKEESFHVSTTGVNENGKVTSVTVHKP